MRLFSLVDKFEYGHFQGKNSLINTGGEWWIGETYLRQMSIAEG